MSLDGFDSTNPTNPLQLPPSASPNAIGKASLAPDDLSSCTLLSSLEVDCRPTFIIDLQSASPRILYSNPALIARPNLQIALIKTEYSSTRNGELAEPLRLHDIDWDHFVLQGKWRIISAPARVEDLKAAWTGVTSSRPSSDALNNKDSPEVSNLSHICKLDGLGPSNPQEGGRYQTIIIPKEYEEFTSLFDWAATEVGPMDRWSLELQGAFMTLLVDPRPASLFWGDDAILLYNEAQLPLMGDNHPKAQGAPLAKVFPEHWESFNKPTVDQVRSTRRSLHQTGQPFTYSKECNFSEERILDWTRMPVLDRNLSVTGVFQSFTDVTQTCLQVRRARTLSVINSIVTQGQFYNTWERIMENLADSDDLPQALIYSSSLEVAYQTQMTCKLEGSQLIKRAIGLESFPLNDPSHLLARIFRHSLTLDHPIYLSTRQAYSTSDLWRQVPPGDITHELSKDLKFLLNDFKPSSTGAVCDSIVVFPIRSSQLQEACGFALFGLNPRYSYDQAYQDFILLLQKGISSTVTSSLLWRADWMRSNDAEAERVELSSRLLRQTQETKAIESRFAQLAQHAPIGICIYRADGAMAFANQKWYSLTGFSTEADNTSPGWWASIVCPEDIPLAFQSFSQLQDKKEAVHFEIRLAVASKQFSFPITWVLVSAYPEIRDDGNLESIVACFTDITQQKWAADIQLKRTEDALEAKRHHENFIDITSHEIRNPLNNSVQCAEEISLIAKTRLDVLTPDSTVVYFHRSELEDILNAAEVIEQCNMHQRRIVDDILTVSKMKGGMLHFNLSPAQPLIVASNTLKMFRREFIHWDIKTTLEVDPSFERITSGSEWLELDPGRLQQIIINLFTNAIKFTKSQTIRHMNLRVGASQTLQPLESCCLEFMPIQEHETARIGADWNDEEVVYIHFLVTDSGSGIPTEDQTAVFSRFSQGSAKDYSQYHGSGLGLFISRAMVEIHSGQMGFHSVIGKGSTFGFAIKTRRLPIAQGNQSERTPHRRNSVFDTLEGVSTIPKQTPMREVMIAPQEEKIQGQVSDSENSAAGLHVLIVEDNLINQKVLSRHLKKAGFFVKIANHGLECLDILAESHFCKDGGTKLSVVLMDIEMPVMNGIECTKIIRQMTHDGRIKNHVPIIATTGNARNAKVEMITTAGVDRVVLKPYTLSELLKIIEAMAPKF